MDLPFDDVVARTRDALAEQGFGVLTEIDVQATMKAKLDADMDAYLILGACNPPLAHQAITAQPIVGVLLPCNVVVREDAGAVVVEAIDPVAMMSVADDAGTRTRRRRGCRAARKGHRLCGLTRWADHRVSWCTGDHGGCMNPC